MKAILKYKVYDLIQFGVGVAVVDSSVALFDDAMLPEEFRELSCLTDVEVCDYLGERDGYGWHISNLVVYNKPKGLCDFRLYYGKAYFDKEIGYPMPTHKITRPPQSWCYVEELI